MMSARKLLVGLLLVALAWPVWTPHVCACAARIEANRQRTLAAPQPVRPCCAQRQQSQSERDASTPAVRAKCCCDEIRWNQSVAKITSPRVTGELKKPAPITFVLPMDAAVVSAAEEADVFRGIAPAGSMAPLRIQLCRWQV
jgi:hypothetical protein